ncbi:MAG: hypothetical protein NT128_03570, partial [Proteobacteria bacterium]|nr:hypothetical protein [Pseudomonadota bacterium]
MIRIKTTMLMALGLSIYTSNVIGAADPLLDQSAPVTSAVLGAKRGAPPTTAQVDVFSFSAMKKPMSLKDHCA